MCAVNTVRHSGAGTNPHHKGWCRLSLGVGGLTIGGKLRKRSEVVGTLDSPFVPVPLVGDPLMLAVWCELHGARVHCHRVVGSSNVSDVACKLQNVVQVTYLAWSVFAFARANIRGLRLVTT